LLKTCRICENSELEQLLEWDKYPLTSVAVARKNTPAAPVGKLVLGMCLKCGLIQLMEPDPESIQYSEDYTSSNYQVRRGEVDVKLQKFMKMLSLTKPRYSDKVLEIGCYDGSLMAAMSSHFGYDVYGCDPSGPAQELAKSNPKVIVKLFDLIYYDTKFAMVVCRNVLEHVPNPLQFLMMVAEVLAPSGEIALEVPDGETRVCTGILGSIVPQHTSYFGEDTLTDVLQGSGFGDVHVERDNGRLLARSVLGGKKKVVNCYADSVYKCAIAGTRWNNLKSSGIRRKLTTKTTGDIFLYGANTCSQELLVTGAIPMNRGIAAIDDDKLKWGRVIVNTDIEVYPRESLEGVTDGTVVICSYYSHKDIYKYLIETLPKGMNVLRLYPNIVLRKIV